jgi:hypothetical protein
MGRLVLAISAALLALVVIAPGAAAADGAHLVAGEATIETAVRTGSVGTSSHAWFTNEGDVAATIVSVELWGPDAADFHVAPETMGRRIDPGETTFGFPFEFSSATPGHKTAMGLVTYDTDPLDESSVTDTVEVVFTAFATRSPTGLVAVGGVQDVGEVVRDAWTPYTMTLRNRAEFPTTISRFAGSVRVRDDSECAVGVTVDPDASCLLRLEVSSDRLTEASWQLTVEQAGPFDDLYIRFEGRTVAGPRDAEPPTVSPLAWPRPIAVALRRSATITVRQAVSAEDRSPVRFTVDLRDLTRQTRRRLVTRKDIDYVDVALAPTRAWRFSVTASDSAGNVSEDPTEGARFRLSLQDLPRQSGWSSRTASGFAKGDVVRTTRAGRTIAMTVTGRSASLLVRRGPTNGIVDILVDGRLRRSVSLYAKRTGTSPYVAAPVVLGGGSHEVRIITRQAGGRHVFELDALVVLR